MASPDAGTKNMNSMNGNASRHAPTHTLSMLQLPRLKKIQQNHLKLIVPHGIQDACARGSVASVAVTAPATAMPLVQPDYRVREIIAALLCTCFPTRFRLHHRLRLHRLTCCRRLHLHLLRLTGSTCCRRLLHGRLHLHGILRLTLI